MKMSVNIGISEKDRKKVAEMLAEIQANEFTLYSKTLKFHWNVTGPFFGPLHALFKENYEQLFDIIDEVAERCLQIGHHSLGTMDEYKKHASLKEHSGVYPTDQAMIKELVDDHETVIRQLRKAVDDTMKLNDAGTSNFLTDVLEKHEKTTWMLRSHLIKQ